MKRIATLLLSTAIAFSMATPASAGKKSTKVNITPKMESVKVRHNGEKMYIKRNQDNKATINPNFAKTSRPCPPFCIQPAKLAPGVETIAEVEMLDYLSKMYKGDKSIVVVDSRTPDWVKRGTIPGSINIPWKKMSMDKGADPISVSELMQKHFDVSEIEGLLNFSKAKTAVMFCNGMWCGQSPNNIKNMLKLGYPAHKIKWYRGGMQNWETLGLSTAKAKK
ncbi:MAG: rhodanese-like domain-containing protein [Proteobacteria bacterium]|nr:rhodanese-like domain-containing protein [Pseudomonadota bacterium]